MKMQIHKSKDFVSSNWIGGKTIQLFISPEEANFAKHQFDFRISTATVDIVESDFTLFPGFERKLMVLEGEIEINHLNQHSISLKPFEQDHFLGDWKTHSKGKVVDFNVIYRPGIETELSHKELKAGQEYCFNLINTMFLYLFKGTGRIENSELSEGDLIEIDQAQNILFTANEKCCIILVEWKNRI